MAESDQHEPVLSDASDTKLFSAEYLKDGRLQIVEVTPFDKGDRDTLPVESNDMPVLEAEGDSTKYVQVMNSDKSMMQLDLLNLTLVRCEDGVESYRLVSTADATDTSSEATVTCVLHSSDNEVEADPHESYVMVEGEQGPFVFLHSALPPAPAPAPAHADPAERFDDAKQPHKLTPTEILEKAKALQKAKQQIVQSSPPASGRARRGRKRKCDLPPPHELLATPGFKLFLYSCKLCTFKCNAIKEMTSHKCEKQSFKMFLYSCRKCTFKCNAMKVMREHKAAEHSASSGSSGGKWRRGQASTLQCAYCPYRGQAHSQLMKHVQDIHTERRKPKVCLDTAEVEAADVLVCGACGYESSSRSLFRSHIECVHGATAC